MKAAVLHANEDIRYEEYPTPQTKPGTIMVRVRASGICGSDIPRVLHNGAHFFPIVLGHEFSGDVVEVGEGVTGIAVGDTVSGAPLVPCMKCGELASRATMPSAAIIASSVRGEQAALRNTWSFQQATPFGMTPPSSTSRLPCSSRRRSPCTA